MQTRPAALGPVIRALAHIAHVIPVVLAVTACAPHLDRSRQIVDRIQFHGIHQVSEDDLRGRIGTQESDRFLGIRLPWSDPQYYDDTTFRRDLDRIERYYHAHGYYSAAVTETRIAPAATTGQAVNIDITLREGTPTRVASLWISGCEPESIQPTDHWRVPVESCNQMRSRMQLAVGELFTEAAFDADKTLLADILHDRGFATARVYTHATIDPVLHHAYVEFILRTGPPSRFGHVYMHEGAGPGTEHGGLPVTHFPAEVAIRTTGVHRGGPYSRTAVADAQRRLFDLGIYGIVRINEEPHRCDSQNRCDDHRDPNDPGEWARVDLQIFTSPTHPFRVRVGGGAEADQSRSDIHAIASFEHFRVPFFRRIGHYRIDEKPAVFLPFALSGSGPNTWDIGNIISQEFRVPEVWPGGSLSLTSLWDIGPDPINPNVIHRSAVRVAFGTLEHFSRQWYGGAWVRSVWLWYYGLNPAYQADPIYSDQFRNQTYTYLEQQLTYDGRDSPLQARHGSYFSLINQESFGIKPVSTYSFLRSAVDLRGYVPVTNSLVFAAHGYAGAILPLEGNCPAPAPDPDRTDTGSGGCLRGWPVPTELRFYSGGATSNRGYAFSQVGWRTTVPQSASTTMPIVSAEPDELRFVNMGGLTLWEVSLEARYYAPPFGLAFFFDASDVGGWDPPFQSDAQGYLHVHPDARSLTLNPGEVTTLPPARSFSFSQRGIDIHPSAGIGVRYISPIGVVRLDLGLRVDELGCIGNEQNSRYAHDLADAQSVAMNGTEAPWYYATSRPKCDFFGLPIPMAFNFAIGEAY